VLSTYMCLFGWSKCGQALRGLTPKAKGNCWLYKNIYFGMMAEAGLCVNWHWYGDGLHSLAI